MHRHSDISGPAQVVDVAAPDSRGRADSQGNSAPFVVATVGWDESLVTNVCDRIEERSDVRFIHIVTSNRDLQKFDRRRGRRGLLALREHGSFGDAGVDRVLLASLERPDMLTIHNMILSDRVVRHLPEDEALGYATALAKAFAAVFAEIRPSAVVAGFDNLHSGISLAVARQMGIPWFALSFTALPMGLTGVCSGLTPNTVFAIQQQSDRDLRRLAQDTIDRYVAGSAVAPSYISANTLGIVARRLPAHARFFANVVARALRGTFDKYTEFSPGWLARQYLRKRWNVIARPNAWFCQTPPAEPYVFLGLHMQPESSIDVWAPFHANQFTTVEAVARAMPPSYRVLVKPHISDADSYSRADFRRMARLPGVTLVSPFARSRPFVEGASLVITTMGSMALEGAMIGKPVLMFGEHRFTLMPSVSTAGVFRDLPKQIRAKLAETPPTRDEIERGLMSYLSLYAPGCYNDWDARPTDDEIGNLVKHFEAIRSFVSAADAGD